MTTSDNYQSYVPVYDTVPEKWEEGRQFLIEHLRKITDSTNSKEIGYMLQEELLSGKQFSPSPNSNQPDRFRDVFRKVIDCSPLSMGANSFAHGIQFNIVPPDTTSRFTLVDLWVSATDPTGLTAITMVYDQVNMDTTNININSPAAYERAYAIVEYMLEV